MWVAPLAVSMRKSNSGRSLISTIPILLKPTPETMGQAGALEGPRHQGHNRAGLPLHFATPRAAYLPIRRTGTGSMLNFGLKDRVVCVTGGASGIGRAGALALAKDGAHVAIVDLRQSDIDRILLEIRGYGVKA